MLALYQHVVDTTLEVIWEESTCGCWGWAGWLGSGILLVSCDTGRVGKKGAFGVLRLLLSRLSLFFGVRHFDSLVFLYLLLSEGLQRCRRELEIVYREFQGENKSTWGSN